MEIASLNKDKVVVIIGCTGSGKSKLAVELAIKLNEEFKSIDSSWKGVEIISSDSMQVYKGLDVITNKITNEEKKGITHHLIDIIDPYSNTLIDPTSGDVIPLETHFSAFQFTNLASNLIASLNKQRILPVVVGGTHYYIEGLLYFDFALEKNYRCMNSKSDKDEVETEQLNKNSQNDNCVNENEYKLLRELDPIMAEKLHPNETRKIKRCLEVLESTGKKYSEILEEKVKGEKEKYDYVILCVDCETNVLNQKINGRTDQMMEHGLLRELQNFMEENRRKGNEDDFAKGIMQSIGCREFYNLEGSDEPELFKECVDALKRHTRKYAKLQRSWIKRLQKKAIIHKLDATDMNKWQDLVLHPAFEIVKTFLYQDPKLSNNSVTPPNINKVDWKKFFCPECNGRVLNGQNEWLAHLKSKGHKASIRKKKKLDNVEI